MSNPRRTLNVNVPWHQLLGDLGSPIENLALPARTKCPLCKDGIVRIYEDRTCGGQWYYCRTCQKRGDLIELAAKAWGLNVSEAAVRLNRHGFDVPTDRDAIAHYVRQHVNYRRRLMQFWKDSKEGFIQRSPTLQRLVGELGLRCDVSHGLWANGPKRLLGGADKTSVERCFAPKVMQHADALQQKSSPSAHAIFKGGAWDDVLIVPFFDLPWRIRSFLFIGREANREKDFVFKLANFAPPGNQPVDLGLSLHPKVLTISNDWDNTVVALSDPILALRLQMRNFEQSIHPLPIVVWHDTSASSIRLCNSRPARTTHAWQILENRKIAFWMPELRMATIQQAINVDGLISTVGPRKLSDEALKEYCWKYTPRDLLRHIQKNAKPWPEALAHELGNMTDEAVETLFNQLEIAGEDAGQVARRCGNNVARRVANIFSSRQGQRTITLDGYTILEKEDKWFVTGKKYKRPEVIVDAILRVDQAIYQQRTRTMHYKGRVIYGGKTIPFCSPAVEVEKNTLAWMRELVMDKGDAFVWFNPAWSGKAASIAKQFHAPKLVHGPDAIGWDSKNNRFVLPKFTIAWGGSVEPMDAAVFPNRVPAQRIRPPQVLSPEELQRPSRNKYVGSLFWATATAVLSNILSPVRFSKPAGIVLSGAGAVAVGEAIAKAMGCVIHTVNDAKSARLAIETECLHHWPAILRIESSMQRRYKKLLAEYDEAMGRNCIVSMDWHQAMARALAGKWHVIVGQQSVSESLDLLRDLLGVASQLLPAYLQDFCERRSDQDYLDDPSDSLAEEVVRDLARYVDERYGDGEDVWSALDVLWPAREHGHPLALADLLARFVSEDELAIENEGYSKRKPVLFRVPDVGGLFLRHATFFRLCRSRGLPVPDKMQIMVTLAKSRLLIEDRDDGWVFPEAWLCDRLTDFESIEPAQIG